ncbi:DMT family transporter [candidate division TA06 bacterium]|nr:DMT family transporter [candidate division TA06 bacterium]
MAFPIRAIRPYRSRRLGVLFAFFASLTAAITFIIAKPVLAVLDPLTFGFLQFLFSSLFAFLWIVFRKELHLIRTLRPGLLLYLLLQTLLTFIGLYTLWVGIFLMEPTSASLLSRLEVPITVLLGIVFLGDRFTGREALGGILISLGVIILKYHAPPSLSQGFWWIVASSICFGLLEVLAKKKIEEVPPTLFLFVRNPIVTLLLGGFGFIGLSFGPETSGFLVLPENPTKWILLTAATGLTGSFLARILYLYSLVHIEVSKTAIINQTQPLIVAVLSLVFLTIYPTSRDLASAVLILAGCGLLVLRRLNRQ